MPKRSKPIPPEHRPHEGPGRTRGLLPARYLMLTRLIKSSKGKLTWAILEKKGLALPSRRTSAYRKFVESSL
jgi:hypothetical protein